MKINLRQPQMQDENSILKAIADFPPENGFVFFPNGRVGSSPMQEVLSHLADLAAGKNLAPGFVPSSFFLAVDEQGQIVGRVSVRHELNQALLKVGGHIGYAVLPKFRRQGFATEILRLALDFCREELKLRRVLLTCDDDNVASQRTIESNSGVLENKVSGPELRVPKRRYWIELIDPSWPIS